MIHSCRRSVRRTPSKHKTRPACPSEESLVNTSDAAPLNSFLGSSPDLVKDFENVQRQRQQQQRQRKESERQEKGKTSITKANNNKKKKKKKAKVVKLKKETDTDTISMGGKDGHGSGDDDDEAGKPNRSGKSRRELPTGAVATLKAWLLSPEHFTHPYPTPQDQIMLMQKTGIDKKQLKNWFTNARRRIWKPMLKKQLEQGKLTATGAGGGGVAVPGVVPGLMLNPMGTAPAHPGAELAGAPSDNVHSTQPIHTHYQQAIQPPAPHAQPQQQHDQYGAVYVQSPSSAPVAAAPASSQQYTSQYYVPQYGHPQAPTPTSGIPHPGATAVSPAGHAPGMNKTDSHAVLMELFARDQDLVRQASESAKIKASSPADAPATGPPAGAPATTMSSSSAASKSGSQSKLLASVPSLNSWPHFSSISSLNNLGTLSGVKSITSMSGYDLASQGNLNKMGNLAQVKSMESMGRNDSYAFLEVFFGDRTMNTGREQRGVKREREDDGDVGLSLDADDGPSTIAPGPGASGTTGPAAGPSSAMKPPEGVNLSGTSIAPTNVSSGSGALAAASAVGAVTKDKEGMPPHTGTLKRAYDDALAARGLISVSRSCEKLTDLALPAKMQKTLSQEYLRQHQAPVLPPASAPTPATTQAPPPAPSAAAPATTTAQGSQPGVVHYSYQGAPPPAGTPATAAAAAGSDQSAQAPSQQYPGQYPGQVSQAPGPAPVAASYQQQSAQEAQGAPQPQVQIQQQQQQQQQGASQTPGPSSEALADPSSGTTSSEVQVPSASICALCGQTVVDTQLRPCGHMFHERCLKPSLQVPAGQPKCPIDGVPIQSALLAVPTDDVKTTPSSSSSSYGKESGIAV